MPRPKPDPSVVAAAHELAQAGCSLAEIGQVLGVPKATAARYVRTPLERSPSAPPPVPAHMKPPEAPAPAEPIDTTDVRRLVQRLVTDVYGMIEVNRASGIMTGTSSMIASIGKLSILLKQLDAGAVDDANVFSCPRSELATAEATIDARIRSLSERLVPGIAAPGGIRCCDCGRALSVQFGTATNADPAAQPIIPEAAR